jgi:hypothetical protein
MELVLAFHEGILVGEHVAEVGTTGHKDQTVCLYQSVVNVEDNVMEFIEILALIHMGKGFVVKSLILVLRGLYVRVIVRLKVHLDLCFKLLNLKSQLLLLG